MSPRLIINSLNRTTRGGVVESLEFNLGVNVIVGEQNSGKSTWLKMLDFLMFQTRAPRERFDDVLIEKYSGISAEMTVGDGTFTLAKTWDTDGARASMSLDGEKISAPEAEAVLLDLLQIPVLRYPQGPLASDRTWPTLAWRSMYRHIYRRQDFWNDLVPEQPDSEQQAVLLQFLGLAESLFSDELAELADKRREIVRAESRKDFFFNLVQQIAPGLFPDEYLQVGLSEESITAAKARLDLEIGQLVDARSGELKRVRDQIELGSGDLQSLLDRRARVLEQRSDLKAKSDDLQGRINELVEYRSTLSQEEGRLARADVAAEIFSPLRVTHCPACDQSVEHRRPAQNECFLCEQPIDAGNDSFAAGTRRLKFERDQIAGELLEASELISAAEADLRARRSELIVVERDLEAIEVSLRPFQADASQLLPESIALIDQQIGGLAAHKQSLDRLFEPLRTRDSYSSRIDELRREAAILEGKVAEKEEQASFETASDWLGSSFTTYLNALRALDPKTWTKAGAIAARVSDRRTVFHIDGKPAKTQLGGTLKIYFSFAYQYALLDLVRRPGTHYPGLAVLDAFPDIASGEGLRDPLGLVMKPFVALAARADVSPIQVILTARDFPTITGAKLIRLHDAWR
jgi:hypothetical protein